MYKTLGIVVLVLLIAAAVLVVTGMPPKPAAPAATTTSAAKAATTTLTSVSTRPAPPAAVSLARTGTVLVSLSQGADGLWEVDRRGSLERPTGVIVEYTSGAPNPTGAPYDCQLFCDVRFEDVQSGRSVLIGLPVGFLAGGLGLHRDRFALPAGPWGGELKAFGIHQKQPGKLYKVWLELPVTQTGPFD